MVKLVEILSKYLEKGLIPVTLALNRFIKLLAFIYVNVFEFLKTLFVDPLLKSKLIINCLFNMFLKLTF